jgi:Methyltransferase domain
MCGPLSLAFLRKSYDAFHLGDFYIPAFQCPHHTERVGRRGDGGKWVCGVERVAKQEKCVAYSFG